MWEAADPERHAIDEFAEAAQVVIAAIPAYQAPGQDYPQAEVRGHVGDLMWIGDPGVGGVALSWREGPGPCTTYELHLSIRGVPAYLDLREPFDDWDQAIVQERMRRCCASPHP